MKELNVYLNFSKHEEIFVGTLAESENKVFFEYTASFLSAPLWLSPYKLPPEPGCLNIKIKHSALFSACLMILYPTVGVRNNTLISGENDLPQGFEHWMIKFNSTVPKTTKILKKDFVK